MLHPDAHPDQAMKAMAERQMRRLNAMPDTLLDPDMRRAYDASLLEAPHRRRLSPADAGVNAPSYSELLLVEEHGKLSGAYRARYRIGNQALPAEVEFRTECAAPSGNSARLVWASADGANGEVGLTLRSSDLMRMTWWTTVLGPRTGLRSGTATLVRQRGR